MKVEARKHIWPKRQQDITADSVRCPLCKGNLIRMQDGAGRLAEHSGRIDLKCDKCLTRWSVPIERDEL
jgi:hypothetical protein